MAFCANCGAKVGDNDKFCGSCGTARVPGASAGQVPPPVYSQSAAETTGASSTGLKANIAGLLCYLGWWVTGIIFLVIEMKNQSVRFHAAQSLVFFGFINILNILLGSLFWHTWFLGSFLNGIIGLFAFILWLVLMVKAYQGEMYKLPIAGDVASGIVGKM
jgi:uncharacterized membrane protein